MTRALGSSLPNPVTALSDAGFLVVAAAGAVVVVGAGAAGVLGAGEDIETPSFELGTLTVLPPNRHAGDVDYWLRAVALAFAAAREWNRNCKKTRQSLSKDAKSL